jgi:hypothetical protein
MQDEFSEKYMGMMLRAAFSRTQKMKLFKMLQGSVANLSTSRYYKLLSQASTSVRGRSTLK